MTGLYIDEDTLALYREWLMENRPDDELFDSIDEIAELFTDPYEFGRAIYFGKIDSWNADYFRFNGYGNIESLWEYQLDQEIMNCTEFHNWLMERE